MSPVTVNVAVEGISDEAIARRLLAECDLSVGSVHIQNGKGQLDKKLAAFRTAAEYAPWLILRDLDEDAECAAELRKMLLPQESRYLCFRIAVCAAEAWLLADRKNLSAFLSIAANKLPSNPDQISNPKIEMVNLARKSRKKAIRDDMVPTPNSTATVGPAYGTRLIEFVTSGWDPVDGAKASQSLKKCIIALKQIKRIQDA